MASPYREGQEAYFEGRGWESCPYEKIKNIGSWNAWDEWMNGWDDAEFEMKGKKNEL
jgi:hypothetical protein